jgi:hypothetical protein
VGAGQGQDRERSAQIALQGRLHVPPAAIQPLLNRIAPAYATTTEKVGRAMIKVAWEGYKKRVLESEDINAV